MSSKTKSSAGPDAPSKKKRPATTQQEINGDWSGFKGAYYHLVYTFWRILNYPKTANVAFYKGNDLVDTPQLSVPPDLSTTGHKLSEVVSTYSRESNEDVWIQLKSTSDKWTPSELLDENLLVNFILNALHSERSGKKWEVVLVSQGSVDKKLLTAFLKKPEDKPKLNDKLTVVIEKVVERLKLEKISAAEQDPIELRKLALDILQKLLNTKPVYEDTMHENIIGRLTARCNGRDEASALADKIFGTLIRECSKGPSDATVYNSHWVNTAAGRDVTSITVLEENPVEACLRASEEGWPGTWSKESHLAVHRKRLENALRRFHSSSSSTFVLLGEPYIGKSWGIAAWVRDIINDRLTILLQGSHLDTMSKSIADCIEEQLGRQGLSGLSAHTYIKRWTASAADNKLGPATLVFDGFSVYGPERVKMRSYIQRLVQECKQEGIKLVLICRYYQWLENNLGMSIAAGELFEDLSSGTSSLTSFDISGIEGTHASSDAELREVLRSVSGESGDETSDEVPGDIYLTTKNGRRGYSFLLEQLTSDEMLEMAQKRLQALGHKQESIERITEQLLQTGTPALRQPTLLVDYLQDSSMALTSSGRLGNVNMSELLERYFQKQMEGAAMLCGGTKEQLTNTLRRLLIQVWPSSERNLPITEAIAQLSGAYDGREVLNALREFKVLGLQNTPAGEVVIFIQSPSIEQWIASNISVAAL